MRPLRVLILVVLMLALTPAPAAAADVRQGTDIVIASTDTINDDLYAFGQNIAVNGTINGDLIAVGANISVDGNVTGDVIAAGNSVAIRGQVGGSVRAAGNTVVVDGKITDDLVAAGSDVTILGNGNVGRDALVAGATTTVSGQVRRNLQAAGTTVKIDGPVGGDVIANAERLQLTDRATVSGNLSYTSRNAAQIANPSSVKGTVQHSVPTAREAPVTGPTAMVLDWLKGLIGLLILGILVVFFFPGFSRRAGEALVRSPWMSLAIGALVLIGLPILAILFFVVGALIGGWWIGLVALAVYGVVLALSIPVAGLGVGGGILRLARRPVPVWLALLIGLVVLLLVALIPILGPLVIFCALLFGMGATTIAVAGGRRPEPAAV
ncbi:MAG TPA: polymer-forming cytoskeletal protein [Candidatus Limnocylindria bacterium]|jgi:cytoskeletal protein CcmA (bactofilin family)